MALGDPSGFDSTCNKITAEITNWIKLIVSTMSIKVFTPCSC